jgi:hypothetical protein
VASSNQLSGHSQAAILVPFRDWAYLGVFGTENQIGHYRGCGRLAVTVLSALILYPPMVEHGSASKATRCWAARKVTARTSTSGSAPRYCTEITTFDCVGTPFTLAATVTSPAPTPRAVSR